MIFATILDCKGHVDSEDEQRLSRAASLTNRVGSESEELSSEIIIVKENPHFRPCEAASCEFYMIGFACVRAEDKN